MKLQALVKQTERLIRSNTPVILTGLGVSGVVTTAYLSWRAGYNTANDCVLYPEDWGRKARIKHNIKTHWRRHIPMITTGVVTVGCVVAATHVGLRRTAAMAAAYSVSEKAFTEYRDKVEEKYGKNKEQQVRDEVAQDKVTQNPLGPSVVLVGGGTTLFYEYLTGRYFLSDMETIKRAENEINRRVFTCEYATLAEFHTLIGQPPTQGAMDMGWHRRDKLMEVDIHATLTEDQNKAAIVIQYNYLDPL
jgi:hypothetical protein